MNKFLVSNAWQWRPLHAVVQGLLGAAIANSPR